MPEARFADPDSAAAFADLDDGTDDASEVDARSTSPAATVAPNAAQRGLYRWRAMDEQGARRQGDMYADGPRMVRSALRQAGLAPLQVDAVISAPQGQRGLAAWWARRLYARRARDRADVCEALAVLLRAGLPLEEALASLAASPARGASQRRMLNQVRQAVRDGADLGQVCALHRDWFDAVDGAVLAAGQRAGELPRILGQLAQYHHSRASGSHQLITALSYPALLAVATVAVGAFLGSVVLPPLADVLHESDAPVPGLTQVVMVAGGGLAQHAWWVVPAFIVGIILLGRLVRRWDRHGRISALLAGTPLGRGLSRGRVARLAAVLGQLLAAGVPLAEACSTAARAAGSGPLQQLLETAAQAVRRGEDLSQAITNSPLLDPEFAQLLRLGEAAGELPDMLERVAVRFRAAEQRSYDTLAAILEPAALVIMMVVIGLVVLAAILPLIAVGEVL